MGRSKPFALIAALGLLGGCVHHHHHHHDYDDDITVVRIEDCPPMVRDHFYRDHPGCDIRDIHIEDSGGEARYHFRYADHGQERETHYTHGGDEIRTDVKLP